MTQEIMKWITTMMCIAGSFWLNAQTFGGFLSLDGIDDRTVVVDTQWSKAGSFTLEWSFESCRMQSDLTQVGLVRSNQGLNLELSVQQQFKLATFHLSNNHQTQTFTSPGYEYFQWQHLALVYTASDTTTRFFLNGTFLGQLIGSVSPGDTLYIGQSDSRYFPGSIDELRLSDTARYAGNFPVPSAAFVSDARTLALFHLDEGETGPASTFMDEVQQKIRMNGQAGAHGNGAYQFSNDTSFCQRDSVLLAASGGTLYHWSPATGLSDTSSAEVWCKALSDQSYQVNVSDSNSCFRQDTIALTLLALPQPTLGPDTLICGGDRIILDPGQFSEYFWSDASFDSTLLTGAGKIWVRVKDSAGCFGSDTIQIDEHAEIQLDLGEDTVVPVGWTFFLDAGPGFAKYKWSTGETDQKILVTLPMLYRVTVTDSNGCSKIDSINVIYTGIEELKNKYALRFGPNPSSGNVSLKGDFLREDVHFHWRNIWGAEVHPILSREEDGTLIWSVEKLPEGYYYLILQIGMEDPVAMPVIRSANQ